MSELRLASVVALALAVLLAAGCFGGDDDGDDSLTLEEYFAQFERIANENAGQSETVVAAEPPPLDAGLEQYKQYLADSFTALTEEFDRSRNEFGSLRPPAAAAELHDRFLALLDQGERVSREQNDRLLEASSLDEMFAIVEDNTEFLQLFADFREVCDELQNVANEHGVDSELICEEIGSEIDS